MRKYIWLVAVVIVCLSFASIARAQTKSFEILNQSVQQGDVVIVRILPQWQGPMVCISAFDKQYVPNKYGYVFIGININTKPTGTQKRPDKYQVYLVECGRGVRLDRYYDETEVLKKDFGTPWYAGSVKISNKAGQERRVKDIAIMHAVYDLMNKYENYTSGHFILPLNNIETTDTFGTPRLYGRYDRKNKKIIVGKEVPHGGVDFRAKTPLPVMAINSGKVLLAHNFPLSGTEGNLLVIDHGSGIISLYLHLSKFMVKAGDVVNKGQIVALSGATPRGTPPHLHLMIKVHGTNVDPISFINNLNRYVD
jgi:murein DD-endopeptidase MepM/ murein hydrolase activator NlpD